MAVHFLEKMILMDLVYGSIIYDIGPEDFNLNDHYDSAGLSVEDGCLVGNSRLLIDQESSDHFSLSSNFEFINKSWSGLIFSSSGDTSNPATYEKMRVGVSSSGAVRLLIRVNDRIFIVSRIQMNGLANDWCPDAHKVEGVIDPRNSPQTTTVYVDDEKMTKNANDYAYRIPDVESKNIGTYAN